MRRKNRKWVLTAVVLYLAVMWAAVRWSINQRVPEGNIFVHLEREGVRRVQEQLARAELPPPPPPSPTGEARLNAASPAYVAVRYDASHVVFVVATDTESRFSNSPFLHSSGTPTKIPQPVKLSAPLAGLNELWEPDTQSLHFFPKVVQNTHPGDPWILTLSPGSTIPVLIDRVVIAPTGCSLALGFLASVPSEQRAAFAASREEYFVVRNTAVESASPPVAANIGELPTWKTSPAFARKIEQLLTARMKEEVAKIDARLIANAGSPGATSLPIPVGDARPRLKEWLHADQGLTRGEAVLDYDLHAFRITPDATPRLYVRSRWTLAGAPVFLMTAWFQADLTHPDAAPALLWSDASWSAALREGETSPSLGDRLDFQTILNEFDADHDGWAELLIHSYDAHAPQGVQGPSTTIAPFLYTDKGLVSMKMPLRRAAASADACLDP